MASIYSKLLGAAAYSAGSPVTVYTVPAGSIVVVRSIELTLVSGSDALGTVNDGGGNHIFLVSGADGPAYFPWQGRSVVEEGDSIVFDASAGDWTYRISGYLLGT